jgi:hypothetical protein
MDDEHRADERRRREAAQAGIAAVEGGKRVRPRTLMQVLSVRFEPQLLSDLRMFAEQRGVTLSDILRQAAVDFLDRARRTQFVVSATSQVRVEQSVRSSLIERNPTSIGSITPPSSRRVA